MLSAFEVVAEKNRRLILDLLMHKRRSVNEIVERLDLSQPAVSKHLKVLKEARLVESRVEGRRRIYELRADPLSAIDAWIEPYRRFWAHRLDLLEAHLADKRRIRR